MNSHQILFTIYVIIILLMFIIPFIYWLYNKSTFNNITDMFDGKNNTPMIIVYLLRLDSIILLLAAVTILVFCLNGIL